MSERRSRAMELLARLRPEERLALVYALAIAALLAGRGLPFTLLPLALEYGKFVGGIAAFALPAWGAAQLLRWRRGRFDRSAATADLAELVRAVLPFLLILVGYTNLKARLVQLHPRIFDAPLARLDALVHFGGGDFVGWLLAVNDQRQWMGILGLVYLFAWVALAIPIAVAFARGGGAAARRILLALGLVYIAGGFLYLAWPSLGPAFVARERFAHLAWGLPFQVQESMLAALRAVARDPASPAVPFFGIAAFPSLHLATTGLGLLAAWRWSRRLLVVLVPLNLLIAWSALVWGWHYAIDFYPGLLLAWGGWWAAGEIVATPSIDLRLTTPGG
jgi:hypothetical protein